tara:strand:+ start:2054 stop:3184 length:1131 start_codon:yes stop_codon:yes gene_type:complete
MHYSIFATKDSWISSGSHPKTGESYRDQNFGQDEILELKKEFYNKAFHHQSRILIDFAGDSLTEVSQSIVDGDITSEKFILKLFEGEGNQQLGGDSSYEIRAYPMSASWAEGIGKFGDSPKVTNGVSWENRTSYQNANALTWSNEDGTPSSEPNYHSSSHTINNGSQSFSVGQSPDIEMDITNIVKGWLSGSNPNYGLVLRFSGSSETDETHTGQLKFFSRNTSTIYSPKLEVRWDDSSHITSGNLNQITSSGGVENYVYPIGLRDKYKESEKVRFRFGARKRYIQKSFDTSVQTISGSYIPEGSGSYSIKDIATGDTIIPFSSYTTMSYDSTSNYFDQWLNTFEPNRAYKILIKLKYDDGQEHIHDNDFEFKVVS